MQILVAYLIRIGRNPAIGAWVVAISLVLTCGWLIQRGDCREMLEYAELIEPTVDDGTVPMMCDSDDDTRRRAQEALADQGYEVTAEAFFEAWSNGDVEALEHFWQSDIIDDEALFHVILGEDSSPHRQALLDNAAFCGADLEGEDELGRTPLIHASGTGRIEDVRFFLVQGADLEAESHAGFGALHAAATTDNAELAVLLLDWGAEVDAADSDGGTPLHYAALMDSPASAKVLLEHGADVDYRSRDRQRRPLHFAAEEGDTDVVDLLIDGGADTELSDSNGHTPLHLAVLAEQRDVVHRLVEEHGVELNPMSSEGATPLDYAYRRRLGEWFVPFLANRGARLVAEEGRYE